MKKNNSKIALDVSQMVYRGHGVGRYTEELARALLSVNSHIDFTYFAGAYKLIGSFRLRKRQKPWSKASWKIRALPPRLASLIWNYTNIPFESVLGKQDLVHTSDWTQPRTKAPSVTTIHDLAFVHYPETVARRVLRVQRRRLKRAVKYASHFIADSKSTKNDLMKTYNIDTSKITVVYPGVTEHFFPQKNNKIEQVKTKYSLPEQYILSLGTREPRKNLPLLIEAHAKLTAADPSTPPLVIAGRYGWGKDVVVPDNVITTGYVEDLDLPALYSGASVFAYPSLYEGFGFPVLEAMACGSPVVTSNISSLPEVAGKAAILVDPTNKQDIARGIKEAMKNSKELSKLGLKQASIFTWESTAKGVIKVYTAVLQNCKTGAPDL